VKFLVDANLPPRLRVWLRSHRHEAEHVFDCNLLTATDTRIWERCSVESLVIVSKDVDFYDRALLFGAPPQVVHVAIGNCSNTCLFEVLAHDWPEIEQALVSGSRLISITLDKMECSHNRSGAMPFLTKRERFTALKSIRKNFHVSGNFGNVKIKSKFIRSANRQDAWIRKHLWSLAGGS